MVVCTEAEEAGLECRSGSDEEAGERTPSELESSGGDDEEVDKDLEEAEVTPHPHYPPLEDLPLLGNLFNQ
jgi:hypothetical protein